MTVRVRTEQRSRPAGAEAEAARYDPDHGMVTSVGSWGSSDAASKDPGAAVEICSEPGSTLESGAYGGGFA